MGKQSIYLDENNHLVVVTDNGRIEKGRTIAKIEGEFEINEQEVKKLLVLLNGEIVFTTHKVVDCSYFWESVSYFPSYCLQEGEISKLLDKANEEIEKSRKKIVEIEEKYKDLLEGIDKFNKSRRLWERPFKIDQYAKGKD